MPLEILDVIKQEVSSAIESIRRQVVWKPGKGRQHLVKRQAMNHLPADSTLADYNQLIQSVASEDTHEVYRYVFGQDYYYGIVGDALNTKWLILFNPKGIMETAFPPDDLQAYLNKRGFEHLGKVSEFL